jgi:rhodanese-related sulfurtransferase
MISLLKKLFVKNYESLSGSEFKARFRSTPGAVLLDVRTPGEFRNSSIRGARNISYYAPDFRKRISELDKRKAYFVYCLSGGRSGSACSRMSDMGFTVYNLRGGINSWTE